MGHDWLLVETLGKEPIVVAQGTQPRNLVPITAFLRRNPHLAAIRTAIAESIRTRASLDRNRRQDVCRTDLAATANRQRTGRSGVIAFR
nr:GAF domain-containing protein [Mycobacterium xenopi]